jgi:hypothetical protein
VFERIPLDQLLNDSIPAELDSTPSNQLKLFG